ncbi:MAG: hypothetical protein GX601_03745 [Anaerolineales bacterium]|nr:hypothetical protein [Anaerolineales bacterium]
MRRSTYLWLPLIAAGVALFSIASVWPAGLLGSADSPLPTATPSAAIAPTPTVLPDAPGSSWAGLGAAVLWVAVGAALGLGIILVTDQWVRRRTQ